MDEGQGSPTYREHAALNERVTRLEAGLGHLPAEVARLSRGSEQQAAALHELTRAIEAANSRPATPDPNIGQLVLSLHNVAESLRKPAPAPPAPTPAPAQPFPFSIATIATTAGGLLLLGALMGQAIGVDRLIGVGQ